MAKRGGNVAKVAKDALGQETGKPVITSKNVIGFSKLNGIKISLGKVVNSSIKR
ncbi:MAG: hypothetical protein GX928_00290 [Ruminococcaceae bacterium]|nr:hypothetical protein [Oscillospiraceae bacterium]